MFYKNCVAYFQARPQAKKLLLLIAKICPLISFASYPVLLFVTEFQLPFILIPASVFLLTTVIRRVLNFKRPFARYDFTPLTPHDPGLSCPSRHASSAMIITISWAVVNPLVGIFLFVNTLLIGLSRIFMGVHFIRDVLCGYALAIIFGLFY